MTIKERNLMKKMLVLFASTMIVPVLAFAWAGPLSTPQLGFPAGTSSETQKKVTDYLNKEVKFVEGSFFNETTTQRFSGSTAKLNELIQLLHKAHFELKVEFADLKDARIAFSLFQNDASAKGKAIITVNTQGKQLNWSELKIQIPLVTEVELSTP
jgi:hypothetical protein